MANPGLKKRPGDQELPTAGDGPSIQSLVREDLGRGYVSATAGLIEQIRGDLDDREQIGISRYGTALHAHNGRDVGRDAYEEAIDLVVYLRQGIAEGQGWAHVYWQAMRLLVALRPIAVTPGGLGGAA